MQAFSFRLKTGYPERVARRFYSMVLLLLLMMSVFLKCHAEEPARKVSSGFMEITLPSGYSERGDCFEKSQKLKSLNGTRHATLQQACFQKDYARPGNSMIMCLKLTASDRDAISMKEAKDWIDRNLGVMKILWTGDNSCSKGIAIGKSDAVVDAKWIKVIDHRYVFIQQTGKNVQILLLMFVNPPDLNTASVADKVFKRWNPLIDD